MGLNIIGVKVFAGFIFFFLAMFFGWMPFWCLKRCVIGSHTERRRPPVMDHLHSMASGVLIAMSFLNLLPESLLNVREVLTSRSHEINQPNKNSTAVHVGNSNDWPEFFPVAELLVALGFLFLYITDTSLKSWQNSRKFQKATDADENVLFEQPQSVKFRKEKGLKWSKPRFSMDENGQDSSDNANNTVATSALLDQRAESQSGSHLLSEEEHPLASKDKHVSSNQLRSLALVVALSLHGFFDGVMLGLQTSEKVIVSLLFALSLHKTFVAVGMSLTLLHNYDKSVKASRIFLYVFIFACVAPAGLAMSAAFVHSAFDLSDKSAGASVIPGCLQAFAVGTFLYVAFTETTRRETKRSLYSELCAHLFLLIGFVLMAGLRGFLGSE